VLSPTRPTSAVLAFRASGKGKGLRFKSPKSGKRRTVKLMATVVDELRTYRAQRRPEHA